MLLNHFRTDAQAVQAAMKSVAQHPRSLSAATAAQHGASCLPPSGDRSVPCFSSSDRALSGAPVDARQPLCRPTRGWRPDGGRCAASRCCKRC